MKHSRYSTCSCCCGVVSYSGDVAFPAAAGGCVVGAVDNVEQTTFNDDSAGETR